MINRWIGCGRITKDPELKKTQIGKSVVSFTLAVNRRFQKEGQPEADFINCVAWNAQADFLDSYIAKGNLLGVEGRIQTRNYDDNTGRRVYVTEVVCDSVQALESRSQRAGVESATQPSETRYPDYSRVENDEPILNIDSDEFPF